MKAISWNIAEASQVLIKPKPGLNSLLVNSHQNKVQDLSPTLRTSQSQDFI